MSMASLTSILLAKILTPNARFRLLLSYSIVARVEAIGGERLVRTADSNGYDVANRTNTGESWYR
jgi:hypothetical protein